MPQSNQINPRNNRIKPRALLVVSLMVLLIGGAVFYYLFDPMESRFMPQCLFHRLTGLQCMGCGSQRMIHALLHGDIAGAFAANAFGLVLLPIIVLMIWTETQRTKRPRLYQKVFSPVAIAILIALLLAWLVVRNILGI